MKKKLFSCLAAILLLFTIFSLPAGAATYTIDFELNCSSVELVNLDTNTIVYSKNADEKRYPCLLYTSVTGSAFLHLFSLNIKELKIEVGG